MWVAINTSKEIGHNNKNKCWSRSYVHLKNSKWNARKGNMCSLVYVSLVQIQVMWNGKPQLRIYPQKLSRWVCLRCIFEVSDSCRRVQITVSSPIPGLDILGDTRKPSKQVKKSKLITSTPLRPRREGLASRFLPIMNEFLFSASSVVNWAVELWEEINRLPHTLLFTMVLPHK